MNKIYTLFNYNYIKIIKENFNNKTKIKIKNQEKKQLSDLIIKKQICSFIFVILNFLITFTSSIEVYKLQYKKNAIMHIIKDNIGTSIIWFIILIILPIITNIMINKKMKSKYYLILLIIYLLSNLLNIIMSIYFITALINNTILGILGILNIMLTIVINSNIIIKIKENYLK